jgi:hypothetical protein
MDTTKSERSGPLEVSDGALHEANSEPLQIDSSAKMETDLSPDNLQAGVRKVEATTLVWTKYHLIAAYGL